MWFQLQQEDQWPSRTAPWKNVGFGTEVHRVGCGKKTPSKKIRCGFLKRNTSENPIFKSSPLKRLCFNLFGCRN